MDLHKAVFYREILTKNYAFADFHLCKTVKVPSSNYQSHLLRTFLLTIYQVTFWFQGTGIQQL